MDWQKLLIGSFKFSENTSQFTKDFTKKYNEDMKDISWKQIFKILKNCMKPIMIYHFCLKERKLRKNEEHVADLQYKKEYVIHIPNLKQALNHRLVLENVHRFIKFNEEAQLKPYSDMNTELKKFLKMILRTIF